MGEVGICLATLLPEPMTAGPDDLAAAAEAIAAVGVTETSIWAHQLAIVDGVERFGLRVSVIEAAMSWSGGPTEFGRAEAEGMVAAGAAAGATVLAAVCLEPALDLVAAREGLAMVVEIASAAGLRTCVEFLPWSGIPDLADRLAARRTARAAGRHPARHLALATPARRTHARAAGDDPG